MEILTKLNRNDFSRFPKPPMLPPPPPPPPPNSAAYLLSSSKSAFSYLSLKQQAYKSFSNFNKKYIDVYNQNTNLTLTTTKKSRSWSNKHTNCKHIDVSLLEYLSYDSNKLSLMKQFHFKTTTNHMINTSLMATRVEHQTRQNLTNTRAMYELIPYKNSFHFLLNILLVPIIFFTIFIIILLVNMIAKICKNRKKIKHIVTPPSPSTGSSNTHGLSLDHSSASSSTSSTSNRTSSYISTLNSLPDEKATHSIDFSDLPLTATLQFKKNNTSRTNRINRLKRLKSFSTYSTNFSTVFSKSYELNSDLTSTSTSTNNKNNLCLNNSVSMSNKDLNELLTQNSLFNKNRIPNLNLNLNLDKLDAIRKPGSNADLLLTSLKSSETNLFASCKQSKVFPRTNPNFFRHYNTYNVNIKPNTDNTDNTTSSTTNTNATTTSTPATTSSATSVEANDLIRKNEVNFEFCSSKL